MPLVKTCSGTPISSVFVIGKKNWRNSETEWCVPRAWRTPGTQDVLGARRHESGCVCETLSGYRGVKEGWKGFVGGGAYQWMCLDK